jgi:hypothetical protein
MITNPEKLTIKDIINLFYQYEYEIEKCEVYYFNLIGAIKTADKRNLKRLNIVYPNFCYVFKLWSSAGDYGNDLFREYNIGRFSDQNVIDIPY